MQTRSYVLEVVKNITGKMFSEGCKQQHVGYMKKKFNTKLEACNYYDTHNPHMRPLNILGTYESDWDPHTTLKYIVRRDYLIIETIEQFAILHK